MAVKFYCPSTGTAPLIPAADHSSWGAQGTGFSHRKAVLTKGTTAMTTVSAGEASQTSDRSGYAWVYGPLNAATISGTCSIQVRGRANTFVNIYDATGAVWIAKPDGTLRATLLNASAYTNTTDWTTTYANYVVSATLTSGDATAGDYLVMEVGTVAAFVDVDAFEVEIGDTAATSHCYFDFSDNDIAFWAPAGLTYTTYSIRSKRGLALATNSASTTGGPVASYAVQTGTLPAGVTLDTSTGAITGTPTTNGTYTVTIRATNEGGTTDSASITWVIFSGNSLNLATLYTGDFSIG